MNEIDKALDKLDKKLGKMTLNGRLKYLRKLKFDVKKIKEGSNLEKNKSFKKSIGKSKQKTINKKGK